MARPGRITFGEWRELGGASDSYERKRAARRRVLSLSGGAPAERAPPARGAVDASTSRAVHLADFVTTREPRPHARPDERGGSKFTWRSVRLRACRARRTGQANAARATREPGRQCRRTPCDGPKPAPGQSKTPAM